MEEISPFTAVRPLTRLKDPPPVLIVKKTVNPGIGLLKLSFTTTRSGEGNVVLMLADWLLPLTIVIVAAAAVLIVKVLEPVVKPAEAA